MPSQFAQIDPWKMIDEQRVGLQGYEATIAKQAAEIERLRTAIQMAITQNECDMLLTGEELRECRKALGDCND